ncbi:MAG: translocation/assembly module TamB domain-containing protein [Candidatus Berkiellales bacterium]
MNTRTLTDQLSPLSLFKKATKLIALIFITLCAMALYVVFTPHGAKLTLQVISEITPYQIQFTDISGYLLDHLILKDFQLKGPDFDAKAETLEIGWNLEDIWQRKRNFQYLNAKQLHLWIHSTQTLELNSPLPLLFDQAQSAVKAVLPVPLHVENVHLTDATLYWQKEIHHIDYLIIKSATSDDLSHIEQIHYQGSLGSMDALLKDQINAKWNLHLKENPLLAHYFSGELITQGEIVLPNRKLKDPKSMLQLKLQTPEAHWGDRSIQNFSLTLNGTMPQHQASIKGLYQGVPVLAHLHGKISEKKWEANVQKLDIAHPRWQKMGITHGLIQVKWNKKSLRSTIDLSLWEQYPLQLDFTLKKKKPYAVSGKMKTHFDEVKALAPLFPGLSTLHGKLDVDLNLTGTLSKMQWLGDITLHEAKLRNTTLGSKAIVNTLHFSLLADQNVLIDGKGTYGTGQFTLNGKGNFKGEPDLAIHLKGEQLVLSDTPEYHIIGNPDLMLKLQQGKPMVEGNITIPVAQIKSLKSQDVISPSEDVVIISKKTSAPKIPVERQIASQLTTHIDLILGDKISYKGYGLSTKLSGKVSIKQQPGQSTTAKGKLTLNKGKYRAYGKKFDVDYGEILFTGGPVNDPVVDVRVQRTIKNNAVFSTLQAEQPITAGLKFSGHLKNPKISFYSKPTMSNSDVMSYLVIGRPQSQVDEAQAQLLFEALSQLTSLVGNQRSDAHFDLAEKLKLDQFGFVKKENTIKRPDGRTLDDTVLVLGKQLSDHLYLHYSLGILDSANNIGLRYLLGKNITLEAQTGTQSSSADVLLSFEGH